MPPVRLTDVGETEREKSAAGAAAATVIAAVPLWLRDPETPANVMFADVAAALAAAVRVTVCAVPGVTVNEAGLAVTPAGSPEIVTATGEVKPPLATAFTLNCAPDPPATSAAVVGETVIEKSAVEVVVVFELPPHDTSPSNRNNGAKRNKVVESQFERPEAGISELVAKGETKNLIGTGAPKR